MSSSGDNGSRIAVGCGLLRLGRPVSLLHASNLIKFIGDWTVLQIMSGDLGQLGFIQNNRSLNSLLYELLRFRKKDNNRSAR